MMSLCSLVDIYQNILVHPVAPIVRVNVCQTTRCRVSKSSYFQTTRWLYWIIYSGLDSSSSLQVITHLKSLVQGGRTIVCTIHQPSSRLFEMFDDLYVLADGQCLYSGPIQDMTAVFDKAGFSCPKYYNRADFGE